MFQSALLLLTPTIANALQVATIIPWNTCYTPSDTVSRTVYIHRAADCQFNFGKSPTSGPGSDSPQICKPSISVYQNINPYTVTVEELLHHEQRLQPKGGVDHLSDFGGLLLFEGFVVKESYSDEKGSRIIALLDRRADYNKNVCDYMSSPHQKHCYFELAWFVAEDYNQFKENQAQWSLLAGSVLRLIQVKNQYYAQCRARSGGDATAEEGAIVDEAAVERMLVAGLRRTFDLLINSADGTPSSEEPDLISKLVNRPIRISGENFLGDDFHGPPFELALQAEMPIEFLEVLIENGVESLTKVDLKKYLKIVTNICIKSNLSDSTKEWAESFLELLCRKTSIARRKWVERVMESISRYISHSGSASSGERFVPVVLDIPLPVFPSMEAVIDRLFSGLSGCSAASWLGRLQAVLGRRDLKTYLRDSCSEFDSNFSDKLFASLFRTFCSECVKLAGQPESTPASMNLLLEDDLETSIIKIIRFLFSSGARVTTSALENARLAFLPLPRRWRLNLKIFVLLEGLLNHPLHHAIEMGFSVEKINELIDEHTAWTRGRARSLVLRADHKGELPLVKVLRYLSDSKETSKFSVTVTAASSENLDWAKQVITLLVDDKGADIRKVNIFKEDTTIIHEAVECGVDVEIIRFLLGKAAEKGRLVNTQDVMNEFPLAKVLRLLQSENRKVLTNTSVTSLPASTVTDFAAAQTRQREISRYHEVVVPWAKQVIELLIQFGGADMLEALYNYCNKANPVQLASEWGVDVGIINFIQTKMVERVDSRSAESGLQGIRLRDI